MRRRLTLAVVASVLRPCFLLLLVTLAQLIEGRLEASGEFVRRAYAPIVEEDYERSRIGHVVVDSHHFQSMPTQRFEGCCNLSFQHRNIAGYRRIVIRADERRPRVRRFSQCVPCLAWFSLEDLRGRYPWLWRAPHVQ